MVTYFAMLVNVKICFFYFCKTFGVIFFINKKKINVILNSEYFL